MSAHVYRYQFEQKGSQHTCPECGKRREFTRYVDSKTGDLLPDEYGKCNRADRCGYHCSPYHKLLKSNGQTGLSYAEEQRERDAIPSEWFQKAGAWKREKLTQTVLITRLQTELGASHEQAERISNFLFAETTNKITQPGQTAKIVIGQPSAKPLVVIPNELVATSLGHYDQNQLALLLRNHFGNGVADGLLGRFRIGTSGRWPGACVFWFVDEQGRTRGGQIKLFDERFHTVKYTNRTGERKTKTDWVHTAYAYRCDRDKVSRPEWLTAYIEQRDFAPCLFGLPQLLTAPPDKPIAVVEAPKTAVVCTAYFPEFIWLAVGSLSYLNAIRLAPLRNRRIQLYPDLSEKGRAFTAWQRKADELRKQGFMIEVSDYLEGRATDEQRQQGLDLADFVLEQWAGYPPDWD